MSCQYRSSASSRQGWVTVLCYSRGNLPPEALWYLSTLARLLIDCNLLPCSPTLYSTMLVRLPLRLKDEKRFRHTVASPYYDMEPRSPSRLGPLRLSPFVKYCTLASPSLWIPSSDYSRSLLSLFLLCVAMPLSCSRNSSLGI
jgi:hypothetical protein